MYLPLFFEAEPTYLQTNPSHMLEWFIQCSAANDQLSQMLEGVISLRERLDHISVRGWSGLSTIVCMSTARRRNNSTVGCNWISEASKCHTPHVNKCHGVEGKQMNVFADRMQKLSMVSVLRRHPLRASRGASAGAQYVRKSNETTSNISELVHVFPRRHHRTNRSGMWEGPETPQAWLAAMARKKASLSRWEGAVARGDLLDRPVDLSNLFNPNTFLNAVRQQVGSPLFGLYIGHPVVMTIQALESASHLGGKLPG